ncbi:MAG: alpha/beta hydrolase family protein [Chloroflexota bacterium]
MSAADGTERFVDVYAPAYSEEPLPVILAPHPITWTADEDYHGGLPGLKRDYHPGWYGLADRYGALVVMPHGHHRHEDLCSLASREQIQDMIQILDNLMVFGYAVDPGRVYACGLSMGGQEALVAAGRHPERFAAICAFNPIVDLAAWYDDLASSSHPDILAFGTARRVALEVGGTPDSVPAEYEERGAMAYVEGLSLVPTLLFWSELDSVVPRQLERHAARLYHRVKSMRATAPIAEYNHTTIHGLAQFGEDVRWRLHEWCDYELALQWLLMHRRPSLDLWEQEGRAS